MTTVNIIDLGKWRISAAAVRRVDAAPNILIGEPPHFLSDLIKRRPLAIVGGIASDACSRPVGRHHSERLHRIEISQTASPS